MSKAKKISINVQGLSRRDVEQQKCFIADPGQIFAFCDLDSAEPTILANYSKDPNYLASTLYMKGKRPYYDKTGLLQISDPYIMAASKFLKWSGLVREALESFDYPGGVQGYDQWLLNKSLVVDKIGIRPYAKSLGLACVYGMGKDKMVEKANKERFELTVKEAKEFIDTFWKVFSRAKLLGKKLAEQYKLQGYLQNDFGYVVYPSADYKCLNAVIQSTVSGIIDMFCMLFFEKCPEALYVTVIHDEIAFTFDEDKQERVKKVFYECQDELNQMLGWESPISFGWKVSKTWAIK